MSIETFKKLMCPGFIVGGVIFSTNIWNHQKSPIYGKVSDFEFVTRIAILTSLKTSIYGACWPISVASIVCDTITHGSDINRHFIPGSTTYSYKTWF